MQLPKDALARVDIGQAFAEYDLIRDDPSLLVRTPAVNAALDPSSSRLFFVGRRGTGKTAITYAIRNTSSNALSIYPEVFSLLTEELAQHDFSDTHQRPFRALIAAFKRALHGEFLKLVIAHGRIRRTDLSETLRIELRAVSESDFDESAYKNVRTLLEALRTGDETWLKQVRISRTIGNELQEAYVGSTNEFAIIIDRIDESWDGSDSAITHLVALMHACLEISAHISWARPLLFLRENVFERVRTMDNEFARMETCVVGLTWTRNHLV